MDVWIGTRRWYSADAKRLLDDIIECLLAHRRAVIDEEITYSDLSERVHHLKMMIRIKAGSGGRGVWPIRNRILGYAPCGEDGGGLKS